MTTSISLFVFNPLSTGNTQWVIEDLNMLYHYCPCKTEETLLKDFLVILKRTLQNYKKILNKCVPVIYISKRILNKSWLYRICCKNHRVFKRVQLDNYNLSWTFIEDSLHRKRWASEIFISNGGVIKIVDRFILNV